MNCVFTTGAASTLLYQSPHNCHPADKNAALAMNGSNAKGALRLLKSRSMAGYPLLKTVNVVPDYLQLSFATVYQAPNKLRPYMAIVHSCTP